MFEGFIDETLPGDGADIFVRHAGPRDAPALMFLHGYPQTSAMWHQVAPAFTQDYHVICPDLRGYGRSSKPPSTPDHASYSKRAMARDMVAVAQALGHPEFLVVAHDRGARVAHRMGLDHGARVQGMVLMDIAPTREMYANTTAEFARAYWHWFFLIQPAPLPETLIGADPADFLLKRSIMQALGRDLFDPAAMDEYVAAFSDPATVHASCEDYRAAATIDIAHDDADGDRRLTQPLLVLLARHGVVNRLFDARALWESRAAQVDLLNVDASHYMAEEIPAEITRLVAAFLDEI